MRIISQEGLPTVDLPYEKVGISTINNKGIIAFTIENDEEYWLMGEYLTEEKANKVMDMLRDSYGACEMYKTMSQEQRALFLMGVPEYEQEKIYGIFRFQKDSEVEDSE